jgi:hypothetical protein
MPITNIQVFKVKLNSILLTLKTASEKQKNDSITIPIAKNFNSVLNGIKNDFPTLSSSLPNKIEKDKHFGNMGYANITYLDLEIYATRY